MLSTVFEAQFFGDCKDDKLEIEVVDATIDSFSTLLKYFYTKPEEFKIDDRSFRELFDILYIAKKYQVNSFLPLIKEQFDGKAIEDDNIMDIARLAVEKSFHEEVSQKLLKRCVNALKNVLKDFQSLYHFQSTMDHSN